MCERDFEKNVPLGAHKLSHTMARLVRHGKKILDAEEEEVKAA